MYQQKDQAAMKKKLQFDQLYKSIKSFISKGIWESDIKDRALPVRLFVGILRFFIFIIEEATKDKLALRATALSYKTLLAIIPLIAVMFSIFKAFGGLSKVQSKLEGWLIQNLAPGISDVATGYIHRFTENIHSGTLAAVGVLVLIFVVISLLGTIERSFNDIYGVKKQRAFFWKFAVYWCVVTVGPIMMASVFAAASMQSATVEKFLANIPWLSDAVF
jgi:membrane protein